MNRNQMEVHDEKESGEIIGLSMKRKHWGTKWILMKQSDLSIKWKQLDVDEGDCHIKPGYGSKGARMVQTKTAWLTMEW